MSETAILATPATYTADDRQLILELLNHQGDGQLRLTAPDGETIIIPSTYFAGISTVIDAAIKTLRRETEAQQHAAFPILERHPDLELNDQQKVQVRGANIVADGTPYLRWVGLGENLWGWQLQVVGLPGVLGKAAWDDIPGQDNLVSVLRNPEDATVLSGVLDPQSTARLSARMQAVRLRGKRGSLPELPLAKVKEALVQAGLATGKGENRLRNLSIVSGNKRMNVAAVLQPAARPNGVRPLTLEEGALPYQQRSDLIHKLNLEVGEAWLEQAKAVLAQVQGWRIIDLPQPRTHSWYGPMPRCLFVTRIGEAEWDAVAAEAQVAAADLNMRASASTL